MKKKATHLTTVELNQIALDQSKEENAELKAQMCGLKVLNLELRMKLLAHDLTSEKNCLVTFRNAVSQAKIERANNLKILAKKHGLSDGWGYNPDSGEIVVNN